MRMTVDIDKKVLEEVVALTGEKTKSKAVNKAMEWFVRRERIRELREMAGKIDISDNWQELEELELKEEEEVYRAMNEGRPAHRNAGPARQKTGMGSRVRGESAGADAKPTVVAPEAW